MYEIIEQFANDRGITPEDAAQMATLITGHILSKVPQLRQVIDDVFANVETEKLKEHIGKLIVLLQKDHLDKFRTWIMPQAHITIHQSGNDQLL